MVETEVLEALDGLQWLGSGEDVAQRFGVSQSTVSRHSRKALRVFDLQMERHDGEWELIGDQTFLRLERQVHQQARWTQPRGRSLRLEATYWSAQTLCDPVPSGWMLGRSNIVGVGRNFELLEAGIVDCWIAGLPDLPTADQSDLAAITVSRMPVFFTCAPDHPLLKRKALTVDDIAEFPTLALPQGSYPLVEEGLKRIGLWTDAVRMQRYARHKWEGRAEADLVVGYGTPLSMRVSGGNLRRLPVQLPFSSGEALVFRRQFDRQWHLEELLNRLRIRLKYWAQIEPEIEILAP